MPSYIYTATKNEIANLLDSVANVIDEFGWNQGRLEDGKTGYVCSVGAINITLNRTMFSPTSKSVSYPMSNISSNLIRQAVQLSVAKSKKRFGCSIVGWNDSPGMTQRIVTNRFRKAAQQVRSGEIVLDGVK